MRLIDTTTLELQSFIDESHVPPYAILSHTWGADEVTLQQFTDQSLRDGLSLKRTQGYWKIQRACEQALSDGLSLVWVDTCCIDKTSSAELSEAINSMFRWYRKATLCYAYLDDVNVDPKTGVDGVLPRDDNPFSGHELANSRWFTRGWTLQELIAPKQVLFYGKGWRYIRNKIELCKVLQSITGINADVLTGVEDVGDESVAERMSWMARRKTTRVEDIAYSLMGIFDVNMPLLYGEGEKAFVRLQEEIMRESADHSLFAWNIYRQGTAAEEVLTSVFASHPSQFSSSSVIGNRRFDDKDRLEADFSCTNRGVKIKLRLLYHEHVWHREATREACYLAVLECRIKQAGLWGCWPAIPLKRLPGSASQYIRIANAGIVPVVFGEVSDDHRRMGVQSVDEGDEGEWIYLRKTIPGWVSGTPSSALTRHFEDHVINKFTLV